VPTYDPTNTIRSQPTLQPAPLLPQFNTYPSRGETNIFLFAGPVTIVNERPHAVEQDGRMKQLLEFIVGALNVDTPLTDWVCVYTIFGLDPRYYRRRDLCVEPLGSRLAKESSRGSR
jgi:hypothetical protein